jgi:uncharacterized damage-inducible protein DinB
MSTNSDTAALAAAFVEQARKFLRDEYLPKLERCLEQLSDEQIWWRANENSNSIGNLLLHLSGNARQWIVSGLGGGADARVRQQEFDERRVIPRAELLATVRQTLRDVNTVLAGFDHGKLLDQYPIQGTTVSALEAIFHVTEHFSMHTGQIILLTKLLTASDLHFYDFEGDTPLQRWASRSADSS